MTLSQANVAFGNRESDTGNNAQVGDSVVYRDVAQLEDGTQVYGRLVLVSTTDPDMPIDLTGGTGFEIIMNRGGGAAFGGEEATFRLEFFDPVTGDPVALNSTGTINDLDRNSPGDREAVTIDAGSFTAFGTSSDTDSWFSAEFENREFIEFTLETRTTASGFSFSGDLIDDAVVALTWTCLTSRVWIGRSTR